LFCPHCYSQWGFISSYSWSASGNVYISEVALPISYQSKNLYTGAVQRQQADVAGGQFLSITVNNLDKIYAWSQVAATYSWISIGV